MSRDVRVLITNLATLTATCATVLGLYWMGAGAVSAIGLACLLCFTWVSDAK